MQAVGCDEIDRHGRIDIDERHLLFLRDLRDARVVRLDDVRRLRALRARARRRQRREHDTSAGGFGGLNQLAQPAERDRHVARHVEIDLAVHEQHDVGVRRVEQARQPRRRVAHALAADSAIGDNRPVVRERRTQELLQFRGIRPRPRRVVFRRIARRRETFGKAVAKREKTGGRQVRATRRILRPRRDGPTQEADEHDQERRADRHERE